MKNLHLLALEALAVVIWLAVLVVGCQLVNAVIAAGGVR